MMAVLMSLWKSDNVPEKKQKNNQNNFPFSASTTISIYKTLKSTLR